MQVHTSYFCYAPFGFDKINILSLQVGYSLREQVLHVVSRQRCLIYIKLSYKTDGRDALVISTREKSTDMLDTIQNQKFCEKLLL